ncbi:putative phage abortive infection protein [Myroides odoratimimus]|uniref:putative phage abortive infection protein n=1 Tax=Myroides odoratimimus TaxID=76832 RepID=UPI0031012764
MQNKNKGVLTEKTAVILLYVGFSIMLLFFFLFLLKSSTHLHYGNSINEEIIGQFGDFSGGVVGTIFSLIGVILFYISLKEQRNDFKINKEALENQLEAFEQQIKEFELQREELKETRKIFEQQTKTMNNQQFESNFYSLLNVFLDNKNKLIDKNLFTDVINSISTELDFTNNESTVESVFNNYYIAYLEKQGELAMYFMSLYRLFKIIEECVHLSDSEKTYYHKILRALISKSELLVLYYNYHSDFGRKPLPIVIKYNYFKHLEILSKLEFSKRFNFTRDEITYFNKILVPVQELIFRNIIKAQDMSQEYIREEIELFAEVFLGIYIDEEVEIKLVVKNNTTAINNIEISRFKDIIVSILIDVIYTSNFKKFLQENIIESTRTQQDKIEYEFKFLNIED